MRRTTRAPRPRAWGAAVRALFAEQAAPAPPRPGWRPWQVLGGPGTGKTALLVDLVTARITDGADPASILVLTHTKQAAAALRDAITVQLGAHAGGIPGASTEPMVRTLHSYAFSVLRRHADLHGNPPPRLLTGAEQDAVLREMLRGDLADIEAGARGLWPPRLQPALTLGGFAEQLRDLMLRTTERGLGPEDLMALGREHDNDAWVAAGRFFQRYEEASMLRWSVGVAAPEATAPALDAAELVGAALDALAGDRNLLAAERDRTRYLLVDDAQHLDPQAATLVRAIGSGSASTVITGDPDQAVFTFRGADSAFLTDLDTVPQRRITLRHNYRSGAPIRLATARIAARLPGSARHRVLPGQENEPPPPVEAPPEPDIELDLFAHSADDPASETRTATEADQRPTSGGGGLGADASFPASHASDPAASHPADPAVPHGLDVDPAAGRRADPTVPRRADVGSAEGRPADPAMPRRADVDPVGGHLADPAVPHGVDVEEDNADAPEASVRVRVLATAAKEAALIADHLRRAHLTDGVPWSEMAVIVRSVPLSLAPLRRALLAAGVPVRRPAVAEPLARRRGAAWMVLALRVLLAGDPARPSSRRAIDAMFSPEDAMELLSGPLGGADQIALRRLRRGIRRSVLDLERTAVRAESSGDADQFLLWDEAPPLPEMPEPEPDPIDDEWLPPPPDPEDPLRADPEPDWDVAERLPDDIDILDAEPMPAAAQVPSGPPRPEPEPPAIPLIDQSSAEVLRDLIVGVGESRLLDGLTEVEAAPLQRVLRAVGKARETQARGQGLEDVLWTLWTSSRLERRWFRQSRRGGAAGMQADRDLDAAVELFDAAAAYVDRLPRASIDGFVEYLLHQQIPQQGRPLAAEGEAVSLLSAHAAAGREWEVVAVAAVQEGIWPNPRARGTLLHTEDLVDLVAGVDPGATTSRAAPILAEERRLLLVACSRARTSLLVTAVESASGDQDLVPSRFLTELLGEDDDGEPGALPVADPGRALVMHALVAELRGVVCDLTTAPERRERAARQLARLADAGVPGTDPADWYGTAELSSERELWDDDDTPIGLSPSTVELLRSCPLRWALERHGGTDGDNPHAVKGNLVHTLVQALAGDVPEAQVRAALEQAWKTVDPATGWHSRQELRRTEAMLETFLAWIRNTRGELTQAGVEVPVDCVLPARAEGERAVRIRGRIDRLERDAQGRFVIVDVKTGKNPVSAKSVADHAQLATYQVAAAHGALGEDDTAEPGGARLVYVAKPSTKTGATERAQTALDAEGLDTWRDTIHEAAEATRGPGYLAVRNDGCRHCPVVGSCPVQDTGRQVTDE
ncbi:ATP-dependent helicase [Nocardia asteroides]|uniref:ATP-dependent helicase n=1 Tax=Nocardia asteroides TaxID=1824 RepID=UPI001E35FE00|nr:PD-(D/E)XK nuclease family protein [Nocardia asteroides]UGT58484.1 PD-(D/E)XK nuclease family protein [Nocardia asteroides]